jgi:hypothetical protein
MRVRDMADLPAGVKKSVSAQVLNLTVRDLEDLALTLSGVETSNAKITKLDADDFRGIEDLFQGFKSQKLEQVLQATGGTARLDAQAISRICDYTCCCCTPCCCCAAAEADPFAA